MACFPPPERRGERHSLLRSPGRIGTRSLVSVHSALSRRQKEFARCTAFVCLQSAGDRLKMKKTYRGFCLGIASLKVRRRSTQTWLGAGPSKAGCPAELGHHEEKLKSQEADRQPRERRDDDEGHDQREYVRPDPPDCIVRRDLADGTRPVVPDTERGREQADAHGEDHHHG